MYFKISLNLSRLIELAIKSFRTSAFLCYIINLSFELWSTEMQTLVMNWLLQFIPNWSSVNCIITVSFTKWFTATLSINSSNFSHGVLCLSEPIGLQGKQMLSLLHLHFSIVLFSFIALDKFLYSYGYIFSTSFSMYDPLVSWIPGKLVISH